MANQRTPRSNESRQTEARVNDSWLPASVLPVPDPKDGWAFRWIRTSVLGQADNTNVSQKMREGWIPVKSDDHPEMQVMSDLNSRFVGNIEVGGLLLCKAPQEEMDKRQEYYQQMAANQMESVDNSFLRENDPRMPMLKPDRTTRTSFGKS
jgi:hypothetical protein|tara:strand:- start:1594 stop:2046 length:453 start_codon:yes stop_codon:yes gene_type:complete